MQLPRYYSWCAIWQDRKQPVLNPPVERGKVHARWRADRRTGTVGGQ